MRLRKDALLGAARVVEAVNRIALSRHPHGRGTVGSMQVKPNSRNVVPGEVRLSVDLRHSDDQILDGMERELHEVCAHTGRELGLELAVSRASNYAAMGFDPACIGAVRDAAQELGYKHMDIVSGAGHDAVYVARVAPTGMIFVPCEGGISHNEIENATAADLQAGCNVLQQVILARAGVIGR
jgi:N-carbamoyl-L-amino-acid hydrolase